ncbi:MAG: gamma-glutamyltransferase family protein [Thalassobaculales bacterium]
MLNTLSCYGGMIVAPHHLAAQAGRDVLREGGNAVEAMVAAAAAVAVCYPHMNAIGGDGFWLIREPGRPVLGIEACGPAGRNVTPALYRGHAAIPARGPLAANTVAGTVSGWGVALEQARGWGRALPLARLLAPAVAHAEEGVPMTASQVRYTAEKLAEVEGQPGFARCFLPANAGARFRQPALAASLRAIAAEGTEGFYRGALGRAIAADLAAIGSPLTAEDLAAYRARVVAPLSVRAFGAALYNMPPPTQGLASLMILALLARLPRPEAETPAMVHRLVEATKQAFRVRNAFVTDPDRMAEPAAAWLDPARLDRLAAEISLDHARPWPDASVPGDTIWMGCIDRQGRAVSFIQSIYWEFGSGCVLPETGILWQNRGSSFSLEAGAVNALAPGRRPFHTLNPAMAELADGRLMVYGTMGGEGQPQTQAAIFWRHVVADQPLQQAVSAPRWLLGRTWGAATTALRLEGRFPPAFTEALADMGHKVERVEDFSDVMGHAGALVHHPDGRIEGAADPRADGIAAGA